MLGLARQHLHINQSFDRLRMNKTSEILMSVKKLTLILCLISIVSPICCADKTDIILYSYNRPMQLYALLESLDYYVDGVGQISVIYRADDEYQPAYEKVIAQFASTEFMRQQNPPNDFKILTLQAFCKTHNDYVLFGVDDDIVKDFVDLQECVSLLEKYSAYGFYLRLGKNLTYCYAMAQAQKLPNFIIEEDDVCAWLFAQGECDWNYPNNLDMTVYRKKDLVSLFARLDYHSPNLLEYRLALAADMQQIGLCYQTTKIVNFPINIVQTFTYNNCLNSHSVQELLALFMDGKKIDIHALYQLRNNAAHVHDHEISFVNC